MKLGLAVVVAVVVLVLPLFGLLALLWPAGDAPAVKPLGPFPAFHAFRVSAVDDGYVVAGVVGTTAPSAKGTCSGRFALVYLDENGHPARATVIPGLEPERYCASRVETLVPAWDGGWLVGGSTIRDTGSSLLAPTERSASGIFVTVRVDSAASPVETFGAEGVLYGERAGGMVRGTVFTTDLERISPEGTISSDLVDPAPPPGSAEWLAVEGDLVVAVDDSGPLAATYGYSAGLPSTLQPLQFFAAPLVVDAGLRATDVLLLGGTLYLAIGDIRHPRVHAFDARTLRIRRTFGDHGVVDLAGRSDVPELASQTRNRVVVLTTAWIDGSRQRSVVARRLDPDGAVDPSFGGRVLRKGEPLAIEARIVDVSTDASDRVAFVTEDSLLVRLNPLGQIDGAFGEAGVLDLARVGVCELPPARDNVPCDVS